MQGSAVILPLTSVAFDFRVMPATAIYASRILTPEEEINDGVIVVEGSQISAIGHRDEIAFPPARLIMPLASMTVVPGFVDVHIHGAGGHDVMEANALALDRITSTVARTWHHFDGGNHGDGAD